MSAARPLPVEPANDASPEIITVDECAALLRVHRKVIYAAVQRGDIPGVRRVGKSIRMHRATVLAWISDGQPATRSRR